MPEPVTLSCYCHTGHKVAWPRTLQPSRAGRGSSRSASCGCSARPRGCHASIQATGPMTRPVSAPDERGSRALKTEGLHQGQASDATYHRSACVGWALYDHDCCRWYLLLMAPVPSSTARPCHSSEEESSKVTVWRRHLDLDPGRLTEHIMSCLPILGAPSLPLPLSLLCPSYSPPPPPHTAPSRAASAYTLITLLLLLSSVCLGHPPPPPPRTAPSRTASTDAPVTC